MNRTEQVDVFTCLVCYCKGETKTNPPCGCNICQDCIADWIISQNEESLFLEKIILSCPNAKCKKEIDSSFIYTNFTQEKLEKINEVLFKKYLTCTNSIMKCPKDNCDYAGFITDDKCDEYTCRKCEFSWRIKSTTNNDQQIHLLKYISPLIDIYKDYYSAFREETSELRVSLICRTCIHCSRNVYKFIGCKHITCVCKKEFCYECLHNWVGHNESNCKKKMDMPILYHSYMVLGGFLKIIFSFDILLFIVKYIFWILMIEAIGVGLFYINFILVYFTRKLMLYNPTLNIDHPYLSSFSPLFMKQNLWEKSYKYVKVLVIALWPLYAYFIYNLYCAYYYIYIPVNLILIEGLCAGLIILSAKGYQEYKRRKVLKNNLMKVS